MLNAYKYGIVVVFTLGIVALYHFLEIPLFSLDFMKKTRHAFFRIRNQPEWDNEVMMLNIGRLDADELQLELDILLLLKPKVVGVNLCHYAQDMSDVVQHYASAPNIYFVNCQGKGRGASSEIINDGNVVTHFDCSREDFFEFQLTAFKPRGNPQEMINYTPEQQHLGRSELKDLERLYGILEGKTVLVGYLGDYVTDSVYSYKQSRITPLNPYYGDENMLPDLYDTEVSANIVRTIRKGDYIDEIGEIYRILILLAFAMLDVLALTFIRTRWLIVNLFLAALSFILLTMAASIMTVFLFNDGYFLALDELSLILLIVTIFTVAINLQKRKIVDVKNSVE
jgi:hypothetical protein